jgi:sterol desaturase/sphingolipid hydroxylase (fatty acid hydroxylase superfamily)
VIAMTSSTYVEINHDPEPIRLFKSDFLEFFTHIHPVVVLIIWVPVALYFLVTGIGAAREGGDVLIGVLLGMFLWTFTEYVVHRFAFHLEPRTPWQEKVIFLVHEIHHVQPQCKTRLVMPPAASIPMALIFYALFYLVFGVVLGIGYWIAPTFAGFIIGYLIYDMTHYATHHFPMRWGFLKALKRYHMQHHYKTPNQRFGVSSPLWDIVFGTKPE